MASRLQRLLRRPFYHRPKVDRALCQFMPGRMKLPTISAAALFPDFSQQAVTITELSLGAWSTPVADVVVLLKLALCTKPQLALELGSYRGYTALALARHLPADGRLVTLDVYPEHGEAYRGKPEAAKIDRRVGKVGGDTLTEGLGAFDFMFIDADHVYEGVRRDTEVLMPFLAPDGVAVWHDYANWGYFDGSNGVPECLAEFRQKHPVGHLFGTSLAIYSPAWERVEGREAFERAVVKNPNEAENNPWHTDLIRG